MYESLAYAATPAGTALAVACVVAGGPWFADGLRALKARRALRGLPREAGRVLHPGPLHARGRVVLESPMFAPLSGRPCARFELEVRDHGGRFVGALHDERDFLLELDTGVAQIGGGLVGRIGITDERTYGTAAELSERLRALFRREPELRWVLGQPGSFTVMERALFAGTEAHVLGCGLRGAVQWHERVPMLRTGTDDAPWEESLVEPVSEWHIGPCEGLDHAIVSDRPLEPQRLAPPVWRTHGALLGPALTLAGLLELAQAAGHTLEGGL